ncbi:MAG: hypothetical protein AAF411_23345 [Myxococcota bacterium]
MNRTLYTGFPLEGTRSANGQLAADPAIALKQAAKRARTRVEAWRAERRLQDEQIEALAVDVDTDVSDAAIELAEAALERAVASAPIPARRSHTPAFVPHGALRC